MTNKEIQPVKIRYLYHYCVQGHSSDKVYQTSGIFDTSSKIRNKNEYDDFIAGIKGLLPEEFHTNFCLISLSLLNEEITIITDNDESDN